MLADPTSPRPPLPSPRQFLELLHSRGLLGGATGRRAAGTSPTEMPSWAEDFHLLGVPRADIRREGGPGSPGLPILGQYRILDEIGSGGMGEVFKAEHVLMRRVVALKVMAPHLVRDQNAVGRFHREVQAMAQLAHANIVTAHDAAEAHGLHFLVMEFVDGIDLGRLVVEYGPLPCAIACECIRQTAVGLQHAFERGLVHCDIKPANLVLTGTPVERGSRPFSLYRGPEPFLVKILDLGLARLAGTSPDSPTLHSLPAPGSGPAGTPDFMAPEQSDNTPAADVRSDLYGLGCTLYFLLTGRVPFPGGTWAEKLLKHQFDRPIPLTELRPDVPPEISAVVERLMAKDPTDRYPVPEALAEVLDVWLADQGFFSEFRCETRLSPSVDTPPALQALTLPIAGPAGATPAPGRTRTARTTAGSPAQSKAPAPASRFRKSDVPLPFAALAAVAVGLGLAWLGREPILSALHLIGWPESALTETAAGPGAICLASAPDTRFQSLENAIAQAVDGDRILIRHQGRLAVGPLRIRGKALTLEAASGCRPTLTLTGMAVAQVWRPLLWTDRALDVRGIELLYESSAEPGADARPAHILYCEGPELRLSGCRVIARQGCAPIVCRAPRLVEFDDCRIDAYATAVSVEIGAGTSPALSVRRSTLHIGQHAGTALSLWVGPSPAHGPVRLELGGNTFQTGRVLSLSGLTSGLEIRARDNTFGFRQSLLDFLDYPERGWKVTTSWQGLNNRYRSPADWISQDGMASGIAGLAAWQELWGRAEPGSSEEKITRSGGAVAAGGTH